MKEVLKAAGVHDASEIAAKMGLGVRDGLPVKTTEEEALQHICPLRRR